MATLPTHSKWFYKIIGVLLILLVIILLGFLGLLNQTDLFKGQIFQFTPPVEESAK